MQRKILQIVLLLLLPMTTVMAQQYEYWIDNGYNQRVVSNQSGQISNTIDVSMLAPGLHFYNIRLKDNQGNWGSLYRFLFTLVGMPPGTKAELYESWIDGDYAHRSIKNHNGGDISDVIDVSSLNSGLHFYNIRIRDEFGVWGSLNRYLFMVSEEATAQPAVVEYWIDDAVSTTQFASGSTVLLTSDISMLDPGKHLFYCRIQSTNGKWSDIHSHEFDIEAIEESPVEGAFLEYFIDTDPGYGKGTLIKAIVEGDNEYSIDLADTKQGAHILYIRTYDGQGHWSSTVSRPLYVRKPVSIADLEYFIDTDPGVDSGISVNLPEKLSGPFNIKVPTGGLEYGEHVFGIRAKGSDGLWTYNTIRPFTLVRIAGNVNDDNIVNDADIAELINYIIGKPSNIFNEDAADVNGDGVVNVADIVEIVKIIKANK